MDYKVQVFPAYAGVILSDLQHLTAVCRFPCTRGGDPKYLQEEGRTFVFSPHTRGGILKDLKGPLLQNGFPRTRGGDPMTYLTNDPWPEFSPHTRG